MSDPKTILGAMEVGVLISAIVFGINMLHVFLYFRNFPDDRLCLKAFVGSIFILDLAHTVLLIQVLYHYTVTGFGDFDEFHDITVPYLLSALLTGFIISSVQAFFSYRVYLVTRSTAIGVLCAIVTVARLGFSMGATGQVFTLRSFVEYGKAIHWPVVVYASLGAVSDAINAATLCITLVRNRSGVERTDRVVDKVIAYAISSGLLTSLVTISQLICYLTMYSNFVWLAQLTISAKLFSNSLLASLNARTSLRADMNKSVWRSKLSLHFKQEPGLLMSDSGDSDVELSESP